MPILRNLYESQEQFRLIIGSDLVYTIREPVNWSKITTSMERSITGDFGMHYEFTDGEIKLGFSAQCGLDIIEAQYKLYGVDANVELQFGLIGSQNQFEVLFSGKLKFSTWVRRDTQADVVVIRSSFEDVIRTRFDTKVSMTDVKSIDGDDIPAKAHQTMGLHSKGITKKFRSHSDITQEHRHFVQNNGTHYINYQMDQVEIDEIDNVPKTLLIVDPVAPQSREWYLIHAKEGGRYRVKIEVKAKYKIQDSGGGAIGNYFFTPYYAIDGIAPVQLQNPIPFASPAISGNSGGSLLDNIKHEWFNEFTVDLAKGSKLYVYTKAQTQGGDSAVTATCYLADFEIVADTVTSSSQAKVLPILEATGHIIEALTGKTGRFYSSLLGRTDVGYETNGIAWNVMVTNGFQIRGWNETEKPLQVDLKTIFETLNALYGAGLGFELINGEERVVIENYKYFFSGSEIIRLEGATAWEESIAHEIIYNQIELGYEKFPSSDDSNKLLDEFNSLHEYSTTVKSHKNKFPRKSPGIGSGWAIEEARRKPKSTDEESSSSYDDELFLICSATKTFSGIDIEGTPIGAGMMAIFPKNFPFLIPGTRIAINFPNNIFTIETVADFSGSDKVLVGFKEYFGETTLLAATVENLDVTLFSETNEAYEVVNGVRSAETSYNLRLNIRQMLYAWGEFINSGLHLKNAADEIKPTMVKNNSELELKFKATEPNRNGNTLQAKQNDPLKIADLQGGNYIFKPNYINFTAQLTWEEISLIRKAHQKALIDEDASKNYGYITVRDYNGEWRSGYLLKLSYNTVSEMASFKLIEKGNI